VLTWINDSDDNMRRHRLDDVACPLACQVIAIVRLLLQHAPCFLCQKKRGEGGPCCCSPRRCPSDVGCHVTIAPASCVKKSKREGAYVAHLALFVVAFIRCWLPRRRWRHGPASHVRNEEEEGMYTTHLAAPTTWVVTVWMTWHIC
jgi:hypothetical protein